MTNTAGPTEGDSAANGITLHFRKEGRSGAPWLVFSNSLMTNLSMWDEQALAFKDHFAIFRYDQRGHGGSTVDDASPSFDLLVDDLVALLDAHGVDQFVLLGCSMGSMTALRLAQRFPKRVQALVLSAGRAAGPAGGAELWQKRIDLVAERGMEALVEPTIERWFHPSNRSSPTARKVAEMIRTTNPLGFKACARALQNFDMQSGLAAMRAPCLLVAGEADADSPKVMKELQGQIPGAQYAVIENAGHLSPIEGPQSFNALVSDFLKRAL
jgi:3-oxoadipate enol-lactonase